MAFDEEFYTTSDGDIHVIYSDANSEITKVPPDPNQLFWDAEGEEEGRATRDA